MQTFFLKEEDISRFYTRIAEEYDLYVPTKVKSPFRVKCEACATLPVDEYLLKKYTEVSKSEVVFNEYRPIEPIRSYFTHFKEEVCSYFGPGEGLGHEGAAREKPLAICGVKNCDLFALKVQDYVFMGGTEPDPLYKKRREETLIVSSDCPSFKESCFCRAFDINPFPTEGFDINLSFLTGGYLVDIATDRAQKLAMILSDVLTPAHAAQISGRAVKRESVVQRLQEHLSQHKIPSKEMLQEIVTYGFNSPIWQEQMRTCVECGGCILMCDTCHCFLLSDDKKGETTSRTRTWDGCQFKNFTRVAGGANPLKMRYMRLRNRYLKKFDFFVSNLGFQACCGCGRCIDVCPGRIDIRFILRKLYEEKHLSTR